MKNEKKDEKKDGGSTIFFNVKREEIGRIELANGIDLVVSIVNDRHLNLRLWVDRNPYKGLRFYLPEGVYEELKKLIDKVDKVYQERQERLDLSGMPDPREHTPNEIAETLRKVGCEI